MPPMIDVSRRTSVTSLATAGFAAIFAGGAHATDAPPVGANEKKILDHVTDFCLAWNGKDVEKLIPYIADTIEYHMWEGGPVVKGLEQFRAQLGGFMAGMKEIKWEIFRSAVIGDIIINERMDHFIQAEGSKRPDNHFHIVGVFLVRDGKIQYWKDYNMPAKA
ncbi:MAG: limonene-1,2-epoxide hydrolase family protein [Rhodospirillaceae bacterium]|nr:limonene-1,2-epoxide hydrolase family protein [Rhodospirillaceae bacterium]